MFGRVLNTPLIIILCEKNSFTALLNNSFKLRCIIRTTSNIYVEDFLRKYFTGFRCWLFSQKNFNIDVKQHSKYSLCLFEMRPSLLDLERDSMSVSETDESTSNCCLTLKVNSGYHTTMYYGKTFVMRCAILYHLHNLKKREKYPWRSVTFSKTLLHGCFHVF